MSEKREKLINTAKNTGFVVLGTVIISLGTALFVIPFDLVAGGISGIAIVLNRLINSTVFTVDVIINIITWTVFFLGFIILGRAYAAKTLVSTIVYTLTIPIFIRLVSSGMLGGFFDLTTSKYNDLALLISSLCGGTLTGVGGALSFVGGGSTGGVDTIMFIICKFFKKLKNSVVLGAINFVIILFSIFVIRDFIIIALGVLSAFVDAYMVDKIFLGGKVAFVAEIVTEKHEEISSAVIKELERTTTLFDAKGAYSGKEFKMVMVSFTMREYKQLLSIVTRYDKAAFMTIHRAHEISGEGWTR
jgi:uncharacterized membrane-anchored protein YitT (DUF2179 family)